MQSDMSHISRAPGGLRRSDHRTVWMLALCLLYVPEQQLL